MIEHFMKPPFEKGISGHIEGEHECLVDGGTGDLLDTHPNNQG